MDDEKKIERRLVKVVKANGGLCIKLLPFLFTGLPDRLCLLPDGVLFFAEIKGTGEKLRKIQAHVINKIRALGFNVFVIDSVKQVNDIMKRYENRELKGDGENLTE